MQSVPIITKICQFTSCPQLGLLHTTSCDKVLSVASGRSLAISRYPVFSSFKTDLHDITEMLLKMSLSFHNLNPTHPITEKLRFLTLSYLMICK
jgi:hypothetical protein